MSFLKAFTWKFIQHHQQDTDLAKNGNSGCANVILRYMYCVQNATFDEIERVWVILEYSLSPIASAKHWCITVVQCSWKSSDISDGYAQMSDERFHKFE